MPDGSPQTWAGLSPNQQAWVTDLLDARFDRARTQTREQSLALETKVRDALTKRQFSAEEIDGLIAQGPPQRGQGMSDAPPVRAPVPSYEPPDQSKVSFVDRIRQYRYEPTRQPDESDEDYQRRADDAWQEQVAIAERRGKPVVRHRDTRGLEYALAPVPWYALGALQGFSSGYLGGIPERVAQLADPDKYERLEQMTGGSTDLPLIAEVRGATQLLSGLNPRSIGNRIVAPVTRAIGPAREAVTALPRAVNATRNWLGAVVGSAVESGLREATEWGTEALNYATGRSYRPPRSAEQVGENVATAAGTAGLVHGPLTVGQRIGAGQVESLRSSPNIGGQIQNAEAAGMRTATVLPLSGMRPPPVVEETRPIAAMPREPMAAIDQNPALAERGMEARNITQSRTADLVHQRLHDYRNEVPQRIGQEQQAFFNDPQTFPQAQNLVTTDPLIRMAEGEINQRLDANGRPQPNYSPEEYAADMRLLGSLQEGTLVPRGQPVPQNAITVRQARERGMPIDEAELRRRAADDVANRQVLMNPETSTVSVGGQPTTAVRRPAAPDEQSVQQLRGQGTTVAAEPRMLDQAVRALEDTEMVALSPRAMNAQLLESTIDRYQNELPRIRNVRGEPMRMETRILRELYNLRQDPAFNPDAVYGPGGEVVTPGHFEEMTQRHAQEMRDLEDLLMSLGENRRLNQINPEDRTQYEPLANLVRNYRATDVTTPDRYPAFRRFVNRYDDIEPALIDAAGHRDYDLLRARSRMPGVGLLTAPGNPIRLGALSGALTWGRLHLDPTMRMLAGSGAGNEPVPPDINARRSALLGTEMMELPEKGMLREPVDYLQGVAEQWLKDKLEEDRQKHSAGK